MKNADLSEKRRQLWLWKNEVNYLLKRCQIVLQRLWLDNKDTAKKFKEISKQYYENNKKKVTKNEWRLIRMII